MKPYSAASLTRNLQELIHQRRVDRLCVLEQGVEVHRDTTVWKFFEESLQVGKSLYDLKRLLTYEIRGSVLVLSF